MEYGVCDVLVPLMDGCMKHARELTRLMYLFILVGIIVVLVHVGLESSGVRGSRRLPIFHFFSHMACCELRDH